jgi:hypothetical protein
MMTVQKFQHAPARRGASGETGLQQITTGRRFPIKHFTRDKCARQLSQHKILPDVFKRDTSGSRNRTGQRRYPDYLDRKSPKPFGKTLGRDVSQLDAGADGVLLQQPDRDG